MDMLLIITPDQDLLPIGREKGNLGAYPARAASHPASPGPNRVSLRGTAISELVSVGFPINCCPSWKCYSVWKRLSDEDPSFRTTATLGKMVTENGAPPSGNWEDIAARKHRIQEQAIDDFLKKFNDVGKPVNVVDICDLGYDDLRELLVTGSVQAETVIIAYIRRYNPATLPESKAHVDLCCTAEPLKRTKR